MHVGAAATVTGVTASVVVSITIIWPLLAPLTELMMMLPFGSVSIPSAPVNPGVGNIRHCGIRGGASEPVAGTSPGGSAPPGPS